MVAFIKFKDHSVKNHRPFNKITLSVKILTPMTLSSLSKQEVLMLGLGLEKELMSLNRLMLPLLVQNFSQMLLSPF
mgnify:CR=1 FL=1|jgi:hypothetical protein